MVDQTGQPITNSPTHRMAVIGGKLSVGGHRWRGVGTNLFGSGTQLSKAKADEHAARLAFYGYNIVRLHAIDVQLLTDGQTSGSYDADAIDLIDYLIAALAAKGIYVTFNFHQSRKYYDLFPGKHINAQSFYHSTVQQRRADLDGYWLTRTNPYLNATLAEHPVCAMWQIVNEEALIFRWPTGIKNVDPAHTDLTAMWQAWKGDSSQIPTERSEELLDFLSAHDKAFMDSEKTRLETLGLEAIIFGTQEEYTIPGATASMSLQDVHAYHDHWGGYEVQPRWVHNRSFAKMMDNWAGVGPSNVVYRIHNMNPTVPRIITEYNWSGLHTTFDEHALFFAICALQDVDCVFDFLYGATGGDTDFSRTVVSHNDTRLNTLWLIAAATAGKAFKEGRIPPLATTPQIAKYTRAQVLALANDPTIGISIMGGPAYNITFNATGWDQWRALIHYPVGVDTSGVGTVPTYPDADKDCGVGTWDWDTGAVSIDAGDYLLESSLTSITFEGETITGPVTATKLIPWTNGGNGAVVTTGGKIDNTNADWWTSSASSNTGATVTITIDKAFAPADAQLPDIYWPVVISGSDSVPSLDGEHEISAKISSTQFEIVPPAPITSAMTTCTLTFKKNAWGNADGGGVIVGTTGGAAPVVESPNAQQPAGYTPLTSDGQVTTGAAYWYQTMATIEFTDGPRITSLGETTMQATAKVESNAGLIDPEEYTFTVVTTAPNTIFTPRIRSGTIDCDIDWGDGSSENITTDTVNHEYISAGTYIVRCNGPIYHLQWNNTGTSKDMVKEVLNWGNVQTGGNFWASMDGCSELTAFTAGSTTNTTSSWSSFLKRCTKLVTADLTGMPLTEANSYSGAFASCPALETVTGIDTIQPTTIATIVQSCISLTALDVSGWSMGGCTSASYAFQNVPADVITGMSSWDIGALINADYMLYGSQITTAEYDAALIAWDQVSSYSNTVEIHMGSSKYSAGAAATAKASLSSKGITFNDGGQA